MCLCCPKGIGNVSVGHSLISHPLLASQVETGPLVEIVPSLRAHKTTNCSYVGRDVLTALTVKRIILVVTSYSLVKVH
jgi:hypothetical protein